MGTIHPWLSNLDKLVRCGTGKLVGNNVQWPNNHLANFNGTIDATTIPSLLGFAENLNVNTEGSVTVLAKIVQRVAKFVAPIVAKQAAEAKESESSEEKKEEAPKAEEKKEEAKSEENKEEAKTEEKKEEAGADEKKEEAK